MFWQELVDILIYMSLFGGLAWWQVSACLFFSFCLTLTDCLLLYCLSLQNYFAVIVGEVANFAAYAFAPAILVTPLGALSIIIRHEFWVAELLLCLTATFVDFVTNLELYPALQRCACTCNAAGKAAHIWHSWMCPMCCRIHHNCPSCSSRAWNWVCDRSLGSRHGARHLLLRFAIYLMPNISWINNTTPSTNDFMLFFSLHVLCSSGNCYSCHTCLSVCPTLWADSCHGLYRCLLSCWFHLGMCCLI